MTRTPLSVFAFIGSIVAANWLTNRYGFVPVGFGLEATAGTFAAGAALTFRDQIHDRLGARWAAVLIVVGAGLSALISPALAVASGVAFLVSELADLTVYAPLRRRNWTAAVFASGLVGSAVDSVLFLWLAFGAASVAGQAVAGQMVGKFWATVAVWLVLLVARRRAQQAAS